MTTFAEIDAWLESNRPEYHSILRPPATEAELIVAEAGYGCPLPDEFLSLYQWHDGQKPGDFTELLLNLTFMTLGESLRTHEMLTTMAGPEGWPAEHWQPTWLPFLENGGGDLLCYVTMDGFGFKGGQIIWFDHEDDEPHEVVHRSMTEFRVDLYDRMLNDRLELTG